MAERQFDVIVVGARCAGSPTGDVDGSQGLSGPGGGSRNVSQRHPLHALRATAGRGGAETVGAAGPPDGDRMPDRSTTFAFDFGPITITGAPGTDDSPVAYAPRRIVLDKLLVDAAAEAGAEVREGFTVESVLVEDGRVVGVRGHSKGGESVTERARVVVGADGLHSLVAKAVQPEQYHDKPHLLCGYYSYWSGLPMNGRFENYIRTRSGMGSIPHQRRPHPGRRWVAVRRLRQEQGRHRRELLGHVRSRAGVRRPDPLGPPGRACHRHRRAGLLSQTLRPGLGVGRATPAYNKDFITAQGIADAFRDAELCAAALDETFSGSRSFDDAMADYQSNRDAHALPMYEFTAQLASLNRRRRSCSSCLAPSTATRKRWTDLPGSTPA